MNSSEQWHRLQNKHYRGVNPSLCYPKKCKTFFLALELHLTNLPVPNYMQIPEMVIEDLGLNIPLIVNSLLNSNKEMYIKTVILLNTN